jgi:hypothetical protein
MRTGNSGVYTFCGKRTASLIVCSTRAVKGISPASPFMLTFQIFPSPQTTIAWLSGVHAYWAYTP